MASVPTQCDETREVVVFVTQLVVHHDQAWAHVWATATVLWTQLSVLLRAVALPLIKTLTNSTFSPATTWAW